MHSMGAGSFFSGYVTPHCSSPVYRLRDRAGWNTEPTGSKGTRLPGRIDAIGRFKQLELDVNPFAFAVVHFPIRIILFVALKDYDRFRGGNRG